MAREAAEGGFLGGGDACPVHDAAQNPFQDVMAQRGMCSEGRAPKTYWNNGIIYRCTGIIGHILYRMHSPIEE
jgi:hypothetical protein